MQCESVEYEYRQQKELVDQEIEKNRGIKKKNKKVKKTLGNEVATMKEECESQTQRKEYIGSELAEVNDAIEQLKESIDDLNEQILRLDLKINQSVNERQRLEHDLQRYKKIGKQPKATNSQ